MTTKFEFRLVGAPAPEGQLDADSLIAIITSLKEVATRIGRLETDADRVGRPPKRAQQVAQLLIGLEPGSTRMLVRRAGAGEDALDIDTSEEQAFDERFEELVESIATDTRPLWVSDSLSAAAGDLTAALQQAALEVEFTSNGQLRRTFKTAEVHRETWRVAHDVGPEEVAFVGRLFAVNLKTHRLQVQDDVGNQVALPKVTNDAVAGRLLNSYVTASGAPEYDAAGRLTQIHEAIIEAADDPIEHAAVPSVASVEQILASGPGIEPGGIGLTHEESDAFFEAMGL